MEAQQKKKAALQRGKYLDTSMECFAKQTVGNELKAASLLLLSRCVCGELCEMHRFPDTLFLLSILCTHCSVLLCRWLDGLQSKVGLHLFG